MINYPDSYAMKLDQFGERIWYRTYRPGDSNYARENFFTGIPTSDGSFVLSGTGAIEPGIEGDYLVKTRSEGDTLWTRFINNSTGEVLEVGNGDLLRAAAGFHPESNESSIVITRLTASGGELWTRYYEFGTPGVAEILTCPDGGYLIAEAESSRMANTNGTFCSSTSMKTETHLQ